MADYPVMLQLKGRRCVVIGAERVLIAPDADRQPIPADITVICRNFLDSDLDGAALDFAATNQIQTNRLIAEAAATGRFRSI